MAKELSSNPAAVRARALRASNPEKYRKYHREWNNRNKERRAEIKRAYNDRNPDVEKDRSLWKRFKITREQYDAMLSSQDGVCAICGNPETTSTNRKNDGSVNRLAVDHNHSTGVVRGLLCFKCNTMLAHVEKNEELITKIVRYLEDK